MPSSRVRSRLRQLEQKSDTDYYRVVEYVHDDGRVRPDVGQ